MFTNSTSARETGWDARTICGAGTPLGSDTFIWRLRPELDSTIFTRLLENVTNFYETRLQFIYEISSLQKSSQKLHNYITTISKFFCVLFFSFAPNAIGPLTDIFFFIKNLSQLILLFSASAFTRIFFYHQLSNTMNMGLIVCWCWH